MDAFMHVFPHICLLHADACTHGGSARMVDARTVLVALFNMYIVVYNEWM